MIYIFFLKNVFLRICWKGTGLNWSEHVLKGRCGVKAGDGDTACTQHSKGPVSGGDTSHLMPRALQSPAELWLKMDENPLVHEKAACSHTLTAPSPLHIYPEPVLPNSGRFCSYSEVHSYFLCLNKGRRLNLHPGVITNLPFGRARKGSTLIPPAEG